MHPTVGYSFYLHSFDLFCRLLSTQSINSLIRHHSFHCYLVAIHNDQWHYLTNNITLSFTSSMMIQSCSFSCVCALKARPKGVQRRCSYLNQHYGGQSNQFSAFRWNTARGCCGRRHIAYSWSQRQTWRSARTGNQHNSPKYQ